MGFRHMRARAVWRPESAYAQSWRLGRRTVSALPLPLLGPVLVWLLTRWSMRLFALAGMKQP